MRPFVDIVLTDLLRVAADAPIEWPVASLILAVFGRYLLQQLNSPTATATPSSSRCQTPTQGSTSSSAGASTFSRNFEANIRIVALESLITLTWGIFQLEKQGRATLKPTFDLAGARSSLSAFLGSPVLGLYHLTLGIDDGNDDKHSKGISTSHTQQREFAYQLISRLRHLYFDGLTLVSYWHPLTYWYITLMHIDFGLFHL